MTTEIEKTFFGTFGIEPKYESLSCDGWTRTTAVAYFTNLEEAKKFGLVFQEEPEYPEITDSILLELICILTAWHLDEREPYEITGYNMESLKRQVLEDCIQHKEKFRNKVQALFKEHK